MSMKTFRLGILAIPKIFVLPYPSFSFPFHGQAYFNLLLCSYITFSTHRKSQIVCPVVANSFAFKDQGVTITRVMTALRKERGGNQMGFVLRSSQHPVCVCLQVIHSLRRPMRRVGLSLFFLP